ncbi:MAG: hypothetical protein ACRECY_07260 [Phyllobacterium sp.]
MHASCEELDDTPLPPVDTDHDYNVWFILNLLQKASRNDDPAHNLSTALCSIQLHCEGNKAVVLDKEDRDMLMKAVNLARCTIEMKLGHQCPFREIEEGMEAASAQIFLWALEPDERAKYSSAYRLRAKRNIRTLRNAMHNIDNRLQNEKADREAQKARDTEVIQQTMASLRRLGINLG